jgi:hypothetical protein
MDLSKLKWLNWIGFVLFAFGFIVAQGWTASITALEPVKDFGQYFMLGGSVIAFVFGSAISWLGLAICAFAFAWAPPQSWINIDMGNVVINPLWVWLSGYLLSFFSER